MSLLRKALQQSSSFVSDSFKKTLDSKERSLESASPLQFGDVVHLKRHEKSMPPKGPNPFLKPMLPSSLRFEPVWKANNYEAAPAALSSCTKFKELHSRMGGALKANNSAPCRPTRPSISLSPYEAQTDTFMIDILKQRESLPVSKFRHEILQMVHNSQVCVISGHTGCGKTTQVPQFILEHQLNRGSSKDLSTRWRGVQPLPVTVAHYNVQPVSIMCTQPRRISAVSVAQRVALEQGQRLGEGVGYSIRFEGSSSKSSHYLQDTALSMLLGFMQQNTWSSSARSSVLGDVGSTAGGTVHGDGSNLVSGAGAASLVVPAPPPHLHDHLPGGMGVGGSGLAHATSKFHVEEDIQKLEDELQKDEEAMHTFVFKVKPATDFLSQTYLPSAMVDEANECLMKEGGQQIVEASDISADLFAEYNDADLYGEEDYHY
ncbi:hypothetical protein CEUSTIGMA_g843.t1 [Chlamydomonas eustigma]|uniref:Helicase ATP-binding domain-containing protein n=1 Tax=Chlamydomonas eustigma TaxID=1157962 RepID=A0A250WS73_9CHLO|nr:hypothetical protein CEUSTIGMA_g843.t1 [Chlamydomonas eustigma]|eukprot:GAX73390.1 hypothetical protein CEUSTIGMA_g843.t1 [Chlamydomonas eustigma]